MTCLRLAWQVVQPRLAGHPFAVKAIEELTLVLILASFDRGHPSAWCALTGDPLPAWRASRRVVVVGIALALATWVWLATVACNPIQPSGRRKIEPVPLGERTVDCGIDGCGFTVVVE